VTTSSRPVDPSEAAAGTLRGKLTSPTRRDFIRGVAAAGASTVFDKACNLWVVTDIPSGSLNEDEYAYHGNNALFMIPTSGQNKGVAFRFANGPVEVEMTGPYFTPNEKTLFVNV
jgi:secreted PhoX family phosphatase